MRRELNERNTKCEKNQRDPLLRRQLAMKERYAEERGGENLELVRDLKGCRIQIRDRNIL